MFNKKIARVSSTQWRVFLQEKREEQYAKSQEQKESVRQKKICLKEIKSAEKRVFFRFPQKIFDLTSW